MEPRAPGEAEALRRRAAELEHQEEGELRLEGYLEARLRLLLKVTNAAVVVAEQGRYVEVSPEWEALFGFKREEVIGREVAEFFTPECRERLVHNMRSGYEEPFELTGVRRDGSHVLVRARGRARQYQGRTVRVAMLTDITEQRRDEETSKATAVQAEVIRAQAEMLGELSAPLLPISNGVVVLPLIGEVNPSRATQIVETLTRGVFEHRAAVAIVDITGVGGMGPEVADLLIGATRAVRLLGAEVILTGVSPEAARAMVEIGKDLGGMVTCGTLQQGVAHALKRGARIGLAVG